MYFAYFILEKSFRDKFYYISLIFFLINLGFEIFSTCISHRSDLYFISHISCSIIFFIHFSFKNKSAREQGWQVSKKWYRVRMYFNYFSLRAQSNAAKRVRVLSQLDILSKSSPTAINFYEWEILTNSGQTRAENKRCGCSAETLSPEKNVAIT